MHTSTIEHWVHDHTFGQDRRLPGERRTLAVIVITALTMGVEIVAGMAFGSMALLADGLHMGSHASALGISAFAYYYTRRHARDERFTFGTGKVNSLSAFASGVLLVVFALIMGYESLRRFISPVSIGFNYAIMVAVIGLAVNGVCLLILDHGHTHEEADHDHDHHVHEESVRPHLHGHLHGHGEHRDHNLWAAYLHVGADAATSVLAIAALLAGKYFGLIWLDPLMGVIGAILVTRWSVGLLRSSAGVLLDMQDMGETKAEIREHIEADSDSRICDLHVWSVGPGIYAAAIKIVASEPAEAEHYCNLLPADLGLVHVTVETVRCPTAACAHPGSQAAT